ncbi:MAG: hypothetical protein WCE51_04155 [Chthoniobacterales bacterium]
MKATEILLAGILLVLILIWHKMPSAGTVSETVYETETRLLIGEDNPLPVEIKR